MIITRTISPAADNNNCLQGGAKHVNRNSGKPDHGYRVFVFHGWDRELYSFVPEAGQAGRQTVFCHDRR